MSWSVEYSKDADKFLSTNKNISDTLVNELKNFVRYLGG